MSNSKDSHWIDSFEPYQELSFADLKINRSLGIFLIVYQGNQEVDPPKAKWLIEAVNSLIEKGFLLGLSDVTAPHINIEKEARKIFGNNPTLAKTKAQAVVVKHLNMRFLINVLIKLDNPPTPIKLFNNYSTAINWLLKN